MEVGTFQKKHLYCTRTHHWPRWADLRPSLTSDLVAGTPSSAPRTMYRPPTHLHPSPPTSNPVVPPVFHEHIFLATSAATVLLLDVSSRIDTSRFRLCPSFCFLDAFVVCLIPLPVASYRLLRRRPPFPLNLRKKKGWPYNRRVAYPPPQRQLPFLDSSGHQIEHGTVDLIRVKRLSGRRQVSRLH